MVCVNSWSPKVTPYSQHIPATPLSPLRGALRGEPDYGQGLRLSYHVYVLKERKNSTRIDVL